MDRCPRCCSRARRRRRRAQEGDLAAARELYASAAYDDALAVLNRLRSSDHPASQARAIEQYRAFCLLALGRAADAEQAIEAVVAAEPSYQPTEGDVSPRVRTAFTDVRRRMLPAIIQQKYAQAKAAFDRKEFAVAAEGFSQVLVALADPAVSSDANKPPLSDLRTLAVGFEELERQGRCAAAAAAAAARAGRRRRGAAAARAGHVPRLLGRGSRCHAARDHQPGAAAVPGTVIAPRTGILEVLINETGEVESAVMTQSVTAPTIAWR